MKDFHKQDGCLLVSAYSACTTWKSKTYVTRAYHMEAQACSAHFSLVQERICLSSVDENKSLSSVAPAMIQKQ